MFTSRVLTFFPRFFFGQTCAQQRNDFFSIRVLGWMGGFLKEIA